MKFSTPQITAMDGIEVDLTAVNKQVPAAFFSSVSTDSTASDCTWLEYEEEGDGGDLDSSSHSKTANRQARRDDRHENNERRSKKQFRRVSFAPSARIRLVDAKGDMSPAEVEAIWWTQSELKSIRKTAMMVATHEKLPMILSQRRPPRAAEAAQQDSVSTPQHRDSSLESSLNLSWYHEFGQSRRGLEHVACKQEGQSRRDYTTMSIRAVLEAQRQHQLQQRVAVQDVREMIGEVSSRHTKWARDLAWASAASDADAVQSQFASDRKTREFYLRALLTPQPRNDSDMQIADSEPLLPDFIQKVVGLSIDV